MVFAPVMRGALQTQVAWKLRNLKTKLHPNLDAAPRIRSQVSNGINRGSAVSQAIREVGRFDKYCAA